MSKRILAILGSTRAQSANAQLIRVAAQLAGDAWQVHEYDQLAQLPHFNPDLDGPDIPETVTYLREQIEAADGLLICSPEYVFSLPGALKNALEWLVSTTLLADKPVALITASAAGEKAHEALQLIVGTLQARFTPETTLLISGVRGKLDANGNVTHAGTSDALERLVGALNELLKS